MGNVYHLDFDEKMSQGAKIAVLPGDPFRSETIASMISDQFKTGLKKLHGRESTVRILPK